MTAQVKSAALLLFAVLAGCQRGPIVRALRNQGLDLQSALHKDILGARGVYPMATQPDSSIDHRRIPPLVPYFTRY
jgi:hypothetical protein